MFNISDGEENYQQGLTMEWIIPTGHWRAVGAEDQQNKNLVTSIHSHMNLEPWQESPPSCQRRHPARHIANVEAP